MVEPATAATAGHPSTLGRLVQRVLIVGLGLTFLLLAYAKMARPAEDAVAAANLAAALPVVHAYAMEHGDYSGLTLEALARDYSPSLDPHTYVVVDRGATDFCIETTHAGRAWHMTAGDSEPIPGGCRADVS
jgi:hypothetical protein